jgi:hypothetical protein
MSKRVGVEERRSGVLRLNTAGIELLSWASGCLMQGLLVASMHCWQLPISVSAGNCVS